MELTWLGHSCFLLEQDGYRIVTDPYTGVEGYPPMAVTAHEGYCSHHHFDHDALDCVQLLPPATSPFTVREIPVFHDDRGGALRGTNTIRVFTAGGVSVAHLGDLGHLLTTRQLAQIGPVDGVLAPVGGVYTLDATAAKTVCDAIAPRWVVPMHYRHPPFGLPEVSGLEPFLAQWPERQIHYLPDRTFTPAAETAGLLVPTFE